MDRQADSKTVARRRLGIAVPAAALFVLALLPARACTGEATSAPGGSPLARSGEPDGTDGRAVRAKSTQDTSEKRLTRPDNGGGWLQTLAALAVVVALIFVVRMLLKRFAGSSRPTRRAGAIEVLAQARLAPRQQVSLLRLGRRLVLVGSGPAGLSSLAEVTNAEEVDELLAAVRSGGPGAFAGVFARYIGAAAGRPGGDSGQKAGGEPPSKGHPETDT